MRQDPFGGADEVGTGGVVGDQGHDERGRVGEGDALHDGGPADDWRALETEEAEGPPEEALDAAALAEFCGGPGRW